MSEWIHERKGRIVGDEIGGDDTWVRIRLTEDHRLRYGSESNRGRVDEAGDVLTARRSFLMPVESEAVSR